MRPPMEGSKRCTAALPQVLEDRAVNTLVVLDDLDTARDLLQRALQRAETLGKDGAGLIDCDRIAENLRDARHLIDRAMNEIKP